MPALDTAGRPTAFVDLSALGVADRWSDALIDAYGVAPDREHLEYYRRLWNLE